MLMKMSASVCTLVIRSQLVKTKSVLAAAFISTRLIDQQIYQFGQLDIMAPFIPGGTGPIVQTSVTMSTDTITTAVCMGISYSLVMTMKSK